MLDSIGSKLEFSKWLLHVYHISVRVSDVGKTCYYHIFISRNPRLTPLAMYAFKVQFVMSGIISSVHIEWSLINRPVYQIEYTDLVTYSTEFVTLVVLLSVWLLWITSSYDNSPISLENVTMIELTFTVDGSFFSTSVTLVVTFSCTLCSERLSFRSRFRNILGKVSHRSVQMSSNRSAQIAQAVTKKRLHHLRRIQEVSREFQLIFRSNKMRLNPAG